MDGPVVEVLAAERDRLAAELQGELPCLGVDHGDAAAVAVDDAEPEVVAFDDDVIADCEAAAGQSQFPVAE
jgi:hypothetical protein